MTGPADLYRYKALLIPWDVNGLDDLAGYLTGAKASTTAWHDGDTFNALVSDGMHGYWLGHVRTAGDNAPEVYGTTKPAGEAAAAYVRTLVDTGGVVYLNSLAFEPANEEDNFGRMLAQVTLANGDDLATTMIAAGEAVSDPA